MASPNDTLYSFIRETIVGTTPATPAFKLFEATPDSDLSFDGKMVNSDVMKKSRALAGQALMNKSGTGSLKAHARRDTTTDMAIEGVIGGAFDTTTGIAKAGRTDYSHTVQKTMFDKGTPLYFRYAGTFFTKLGLTVDASSNATFSFDTLSMTRSTGTAALASASETAAVQGPTLTGLDVGTINIAGVTGVYTSLDFSVEQGREVSWGLGSADGVDVNVTSSPRMVKLTVQMLRKNLSIDALAGTTVSVDFTIGSGAGKAYKFQMPAAVASFPKDQASGSAAVVSIDFTAVEDATSGTDLIVTKV